MSRRSVSKVGFLPTVYRSDHPDVKAALDQWQKDEKAWRRRIKKLMKELDPGGQRRAMYSTVWGTSRLVGLSAAPDDWKEPPPGWRYERKNHMILPKRSTPAGKEIAAKLEAHHPLKDVRHMLPGMPGDAFLGFSHVMPGLEPHGDHIYIIWPEEVTQADAEALRDTKNAYLLTDKVDLSIWEKVRYSSYVHLLEGERCEAANHDVDGECICGEVDERRRA